jgi:hypothetical protein
MNTVIDYEKIGLNDYLCDGSSLGSGQINHIKSARLDSTLRLGPRPIGSILPAISVEANKIYQL